MTTKKAPNIRPLADRIVVEPKELEQKNIDLESMNSELQSFAYISSHDLQEPLRKIQTFSTQIIDKEFQNLSESGKDKFQRMQKAASRMQTLIEDLLMYSRTNSAERKFEIIPMKKIIQEVSEDLKEEILQKNATIEVGDVCDVKVISFQFRQLMYNLISNSLKFASSERASLISINSKLIKGEKINNSKVKNETIYCHIHISDNGIGFEQQYSEKIFEVFQRLHGKSEYSGTGLGLSIVKKIVENHYGVITASGEINHGAIFDIYIPAE